MTVKWPAGLFCWTDLGTTDITGAKAFYSKLFGWELEDVPMPDGSGTSYTMARVRGQDVCGLYPLRPEMRAAGVPAHWLAYISSDDVDASAALAGKLGATVEVPPFDIPETGRMSLIADPTGARVAIWQTDSPHGGAAMLEGAPGSLGWVELITDNVDAAGSFYAKLTGWTPEFGTNPMPYTTFRVDGRPVAGMMEKPPDMAGAPNHWSIYYSVQDADAAFATAQKLGAGAIVPPMDIPGVGRFACVIDPQGAVFNVITFSMPM
jgi:hypothetical protein